MKIDDLPKIPKPTKQTLSQEELSTMKDYRLQFLQPLRQNNIRGQTTKDTGGTLPLYANEQQPPTPSPIDYQDFYMSQPDQQRHLLFSKGQTVLFFRKVRLLLEYAKVM